MVNNINHPEDLDQARVDVAHAPPKPKRRRKRKPVPMPMPMPMPMPANLEPWVKKAEKRMHSRPASPGIMLEPAPGGWSALQLAARQPEGMGNSDRRCIRQPLDVSFQDPASCRDMPAQERQDADGWRPNEIELNAMLAIISGVRPKNEIEAMQAAQMCAIHMMHLRLSSYALGHGGAWVDDRTAAIISKLSRTFSLQAETLLKLKGRRRTVRQVITVVNEKHVHLEGEARKIGTNPMKHARKRCRKINRGNLQACAVRPGAERRLGREHRAAAPRCAKGEVQAPRQGRGSYG